MTRYELKYFIEIRHSNSGCSTYYHEKISAENDKLAYANGMERMRQVFEQTAKGMQSEPRTGSIVTIGLATRIAAILEMDSGRLLDISPKIGYGWFAFKDWIVDEVLIDIRTERYSREIKNK